MTYSASQTLQRQHINMTDSTQDYQNLDPETILQAVESLGYWCDARTLTLNSYENRVYRVGIEEQPAVIAKFYRPHRWTDAQILEEHQLTQDLADQEIPVIAPIQQDGQTLFEYENYRFSLYPLTAGHAPELDNLHHLEWIGRSIGRMHTVSRYFPFQTRPHINIESYAIQPVEWIKSHDFIPNYIVAAYEAITDQLIPKLQSAFDQVDTPSIRLHGDCHAGNILWSDDIPHFVDFDDSRMGIAMQDLWMLLSGDQQEQALQLQKVLKGYGQFMDINPAEIALIEPLRTLRMIHYSGWLAQRWSDPAFPMNFPWFSTESYWESHILSLKEQYSLLDEEPIAWIPEYD